MKWKRAFPKRYTTKEIGKVKDLVCYVREGEDPDKQWKNTLPRSMIKPTIKWFHLVTGHPGSKQLRLTLKKKYHYPYLRAEVDKFVCPY